MNRIALSLLLAAACLIAALPAHAEDANKQTVAAMETWLGDIDAGKYAESWKAASADFQKSITEYQWVEALKHVRGPLGALKERKLVSALPQTEVKGTIERKITTLQFDTAFENLRFARETVTFVEEDGTWKAAGYYIKPR